MNQKGVVNLIIIIYPLWAVSWSVLPDSGNCPQIKGILVVFRDQNHLEIFFFFF